MAKEKIKISVNLKEEKGAVYVEVKRTKSVSGSKIKVTIKKGDSNVTRETEA